MQIKRWVLVKTLLSLVLFGCGDNETAKMVEKAKEQVSLILIDPSSAQFRNIQTVKDTFVCGEVNGKNRFGGYVGFQPFLYVAGRAGATGTVMMEKTCPKP